MKTESLRPYLSLMIIVVSMLGVVFIKMENRRLGYALLKQAHQKKVAEGQHRLKVMAYARMTRPDRVENYAQTRLDLQRASTGQIIPLTNHRVTLRQ